MRRTLPNVACSGLPLMPLAPLPGECMWRIARAGAMVIDVAYGTMATKHNF